MRRLLRKIDELIRITALRLVDVLRRTAEVRRVDAFRRIAVLRRSDAFRRIAVLRRSDAFRRIAVLRRSDAFRRIVVLRRSDAFRRIVVLGLSALLLACDPFESGIGSTVIASTESDSEAETVSVTGIEFTDMAVTIGVGQNYQLQVNIYPEDATDKSLTWKSTNSSVVLVSQSGVVTGKKKGAATIDAITNDGGLSASVRVTVTDSVKVTGVKLNKKSKTLKVGKSVKLKATVKPSKATNKAVTWKSSNKKVAKVDKSGKVTAVKKGKTVITVKTKDGKYTAKCKITVK